MTTIKDYLEELVNQVIDAKETTYSENHDPDDAEMQLMGDIEQLVYEAHENIKDVLLRGLGE